MEVFLVFSALFAVALASVEILPNSAPLGYDGRIVDTPEVAHARAAHVAAHINEKVSLVNEAAENNAVCAAPAVVSAYNAPVLAGVHGLGYPKMIY